MTKVAPDALTPVVVPQHVTSPPLLPPSETYWLTVYTPDPRTLPPAVRKYPLMSCCAAAPTFRQMLPFGKLTLPDIWKMSLLPLASPKTTWALPPMYRLLLSWALPILKLFAVLLPLPNVTLVLRSEE